MNMNSGMQQSGMQMNNGMQQPGMQMNNGIQQPGMQRTRWFVEMSVRCREYRKVLRILWPAKTILSDDRQSGQNCSLCL